MSTLVLGSNPAKQFRRRDLTQEDQNFLALFAILGLATWSMLVYSRTLPEPVVDVRAEQPIRVARVRIKPPPPPPPKIEEPAKPVPLPPTPKKAETKPEPKAKKVEAKPPPAKKKPIVAKAPPKRKPVASRGLLSALSKRKARDSSPSQRIGKTMPTNLRAERDLTQDVSTMTGSVGARRKANIDEIESGLQTNSGSEVEVKGKVVTAVAGPDAPTLLSGGEGSGTSGRTLSEVRRYVARRISELKYLYDRELKKQPSLGGKVTVAFEIQAPGTVTGVRIVDSGLGHPSLENQIVARIQRWKFPANDGPPTAVRFPFDFVSPAG